MSKYVSKLISLPGLGFGLLVSCLKSSSVSVTRLVELVLGPGGLHSHSDLRHVHILVGRILCPETFFMIVYSMARTNICGPECGSD